MQISLRNSKFILIATSFCCLCSLFTNTSRAQIRFGNGKVGEVIGRGGANLAESNLAALQTDPELESILEKAKRFQADGNFRVATKLMQAVLERSGDSLFSDDEQTYFSLVRQVEQQLAALPPEGLAAYRLEADAEALSIIAAGERGNLTDALSQVVGKFFMSSVGDKAAVRLGRLYLDRYDFVSARRVFEKALTHPDLSLSENEILAHIAVCDLFLNDLESAQLKSEQLIENAPDLRITRLLADEVEEIEAGRDSLSSARRNPTAKWSMPLASEMRYGVGLPVADRMLGKDLVSVFQYYFDPSLRFSKTRRTSGGFLAGSKAHGKMVSETWTSFDKKMMSNREKHGWRPTGILLFGPDEVYIKTADDMIALKKSELPLEADSERGGVMKNDDPMIGWQSLWKNLYELDASTAMRTGLMNRGRGGFRARGAATAVNSPTPFNAPDVQTYGDTVAAQFSIHDGVLYSIEGRAGTNNMTRTSRPHQRMTFGQRLSRSRENFLVAYDTTQGGKVLWTVPPEVSDDDGADDLDENGEEISSKFLKQGGLMGAPVGYQDSIIAPVNQNGSIWIYAFDPNNKGATLWKSHLCDEPSTGANPWSAINVSIDGNDVLVSCGLGVVFVLDAATGQIRIARRYERGGKLDNLEALKFSGIRPFAFNEGWSSDTIIPYGQEMICFCSDASVIESIDRETGKTLWKSDFEPVSKKLDYLLGVYDGVLYAAGPETIAALDLETRKLIWGGDDLFDGEMSMGKGMLTPQGIFVPVASRIFQFDLMPKKLTTQPEPVRTISVDLGGANLGNLFSDGERFWVHGGNRIYALEAKPE